MAEERERIEDMACGFNIETIHLPVSCARDDVLLAMDIGGSLAKLVYLPRHSTKGVNGKKETCLKLVTFDNNELDACLSFVRHDVYNCRNHNHVRVHATGVGCMKYRERIANTLGVQLDADSDELLHTARGVAFLWRHLPPERLLHEGSDLSGLSFNTSIQESGLTPCVLVNLGSALTIVEVKKDGSVTGVVGGSSQGGLTLLGLGALLTGSSTHSELMELASKGDRRNIDLLVKDTAGADYSVSSSESMVSSFGKVAKQRANNPDARFRDEDVASSLLYCITDQLAANAYLVAKCQGLTRVVFCGSYLASNPQIIQQIIAKLINCSSFLQHKILPAFLKHEGYLGAIGLLANQISSLANNQSDSQEVA